MLYHKKIFAQKQKIVPITKNAPKFESIIFSLFLIEEN